MSNPHADFLNTGAGPEREQLQDLGFPLGIAMFRGVVRLGGCYAIGL